MKVRKVTQKVDFLCRRRKRQEASRQQVDGLGVEQFNSCKVGKTKAKDSTKKKGREKVGSSEFARLEVGNEILETDKSNNGAGRNDMYLVWLASERLIVLSGVAVSGRSRYAPDRGRTRLLEERA